MALVYKSICNEMDGLLFRITGLVEKEVKYKTEIEKMMNSGFIHIAKARYIMGSTCVTKMQLPTSNSNEIKPVATVCRAKLNDHMVFHIHRKDGNISLNVLSPYHIEEEKKHNEKALKECISEDVFHLALRSSVEFKKLLQNNSRLLKNSKSAFQIDDSLYKEYNEELLDELSTDSGSNNSSTSITDPIRLFGILVPASLKEAQSIFKDVLNLLAKSATLSSELREVLSRYSNLDKAKKLIEAAAKDIKMDISRPKVYWTPSEVSSATSYSAEEQVEEIEEEGESVVSIQKRVRSVFYDLGEAEMKEELTIWGSEASEFESEEA